MGYLELKTKLKCVVKLHFWKSSDFGVPYITIIHKSNTYGSAFLDSIYSTYRWTKNYSYSIGPSKKLKKKKLKKN